MKHSDGPSVTELVIFCGFLMALSGFTTDIMLPAFAQMTQSLSTSLNKVQLTIAIFALFFGIGQFFYGPASDRFGRKPVIAVGMIIFLLGTVLATLGSSIDIVLAGRGLQGLGAGAAPVVGRAILRDTHSGSALARAMALSMAIFAVGPIFAPLLGYAVVELSSWRGIFGLTGIAALALLMFDLFRYRETNAAPDRGALQPHNLWRAVKTIMVHRQSSYFLFCGTVAYCALFTFISNAPRIYVQAFGVQDLGFAMLFAICGIGIVLGQAANRALLPRFGILVLLRISSAILFLASSSIGLLSYFDLINEWSFTALMFCFNTSFLVVMSNTAALCLDPHPKIAGLASAFYGSVTNLCGATFIATTVFVAGAGILNWSIVMTLLTGICVIFIWAARPKNLTFN